MTVRSVHRRVLDRHQLVEPVARDHEAADVLREVAREADQLARQLEPAGAMTAGSVGVEAGLAQRARVMASLRPSHQCWLLAASTWSSRQPSALPTSRSARAAR
jgi:hypothetical protein